MAIDDQDQLNFPAQQCAFCSTAHGNESWIAMCSCLHHPWPCVTLYGNLWNKDHDAGVAKDPTGPSGNCARGIC
jgi:hypothetical protein